jgi:NAD(P)H-flavin reductase
LNDDEILTYAATKANEMPARDPEAERRRQTFRVADVWREGRSYVGVRVAVDDPDFIRSHERPGQYVTFQFGELDPRFLVIANAPDPENEAWEFLIDDDSDLGEELEALEAGDEVVLSPAEGSGYPSADLAGRHILMFTTGSGIASMRPVIQYWSRRREGAPGALALYYGEVAEDDFAYVREFADWRRSGVRLFRAIEDTPQPQEGYRYVQHAFEDDNPNLEHAYVFVSGAPVMMEMIVAKLVGLGVDPERIFTNI